MVIYEDVSNEDNDISLVEEIPQEDDPTPPFDPPEFELMISLNTLTGFSAPHTLKLIGYIKHRKSIILVRSGNTHNLSIDSFPKNSIDIFV